MLLLLISAGQNIYLYCLLSFAGSVAFIPPNEITQTITNEVTLPQDCSAILSSSWLNGPYGWYALTSSKITHVPTSFKKFYPGRWFHWLVLCTTVNRRKTVSPHHWTKKNWNATSIYSRLTAGKFAWACACFACVDNAFASRRLRGCKQYFIQFLCF